MTCVRLMQLEDGKMNDKLIMIDQKQRHPKECCLGKDDIEITGNVYFFGGVAFGLVVAILVFAFYAVL